MTVSTQLPTGSWTLDTSETDVTVSVRKLGLFTVPATLAVTAGRIAIDENHEVADVEITVDASSYASKNGKRNAHVVGPDFLDAGNHPTIVFRSGGLTGDAGDYAADGSLTIKGTSFPLDVSITDVEVDGATGSFTATASVDRTAIGVDKMPSFIVGKTLELNVEARATKVE